MKLFKKYYQYLNWGGRYINDNYLISTTKLNESEIAKSPKRYDIINYLLKFLDRESIYLEIGVRNPAINFDLINASKKYSVDPGIEFKENPVDFKMTSDDFFENLRGGKILDKKLKFDVIFIDGLHLAEQVDRDIENALFFIKDDGFIVLHDCNPPTEWHAREEHQYRMSPAGNNWNGTTWKAFVKARQNKDIFSCCIDTDWGVGIISKSHDFKQNQFISNPFYEFKVFQAERNKSLGLVGFEEFKTLIGQKELI